MQLDEFLRTHCPKVHSFRLLVPVHNPIDPPVGAVPDFGVGSMARVLVVPVDQVHASVRGVFHVDAAEPAVVGFQKILSVTTDVAAALRLQNVAVDAVAVDVVEEQFASVFLRPVVAEVNHGSAVSVSAAGVIGSFWHIGFVAPPRVVFDVAGVVQVVGDGFDIVVGVRVEVLTRLPLIAGSGDDVIQMRNDARRDERVALLVEVQSPRVAGSFREHFELVPLRMVSPDTCVEFGSLVVGSARFADLGMREDAVASVKPTVGAPDE